MGYCNLPGPGRPGRTAQKQLREGEMPASSMQGRDAAAGLGISRLSKAAESARFGSHVRPSSCLIFPPPKAGWYWAGREKPGIPPLERIRNALRAALASVNTESTAARPSGRSPSRGGCCCPLCPRTHRQAHPGASSHRGAPPGLQRRPEGA